MQFFVPVIKDNTADIVHAFESEILEVRSVVSNIMVKHEGAFDLDSILREIGQKGKFQVIGMALVLLPAFFCGSPAVEYLFTSMDVPYRCFIPECEIDLSNAVYDTDWLNMAIPIGEKCRRFASTEVSPRAGQCSAEFFNRNHTVACEEYVFGANNSLIADFKIPCEDWKRSMMGTVGNIGYLIILPVTGLMSDRFGRKIVLIFNAINAGLFLVLRSYSTSYEMYIILTLMAALLGSGVYSTCFLIAVEMFSKEYRHIAGVSISIVFCLGQAMVGLLAWLIPDWRTLSRVLNYPQVIAVAYFFLMNESIRWLISSGEIKKAKNILMKAAKMNGSELSKDSLEALNESIHATTPRDQEVLPVIQEQALLIQVIKSKTMLRRALTTPLWWICVTLVYYGLSINSVGLTGNMYLNFGLVVLIEIPGYLIALYTMNTIGRKMSLCIAFLVCSVANLAFPFVPKGMEWLQLTIFLIGKMFISGAMTTNYLYTLELYPTQTRHSLVAFSSMIGRIGSMTAPLTPLLASSWSPLPNVLFGLIAFISSVTVLTMPETLGTELPNTIAEADHTSINSLKRKKQRNQAKYFF